jgi:molybdopterin-guanine dinucleotide biosynthesis protein A
MTRRSVAAAILAGGRARRFGGTLKNTLEIGGRRIIDRQIDALRQVADPIFIVAPDAAPFVSLGLEVVPDVLPGCGALGGIYTAILRSPRWRTLVVAGDMPCLPAGLLAHLGRDSTADIVVPRGARGYEPLCAVYSRQCAGPIQQRLDRGLLRASVLPDGVQIEEVGPEMLAAYDPDGLLFLNVNTPHDYERARNLIESMPQERKRSYHG